MAEAVAATIATQGRLVAEAGTGTGKTFAYLVPALRSGGKVIISTGTKTLQDQLYERDLPLVRDALKLPVTLAVLKGRANYVCLHHLARAESEGRLPSRDDARYLPRIARFARTSDRGDRGQLADVPENATIWPLVTSTRDNCLGSQCPQFRDCFVMKARKDALEADVVVVNHHLFFADVMLRDEGLAELLARVQHGDPRRGAPVARHGDAVLRRGRDGRPGRPRARCGSRHARRRARHAGPAARRGRPVAGEPAPAARLRRSPRQVPREALLACPAFADAVAELAAALDRCKAAMAFVADRSEDLAQIAARADDLARRVERRLAPDAAASPDDERWIRWLDVTRFGALSPLSVARLFRGRHVDSGARVDPRRPRWSGRQRFRPRHAAQQ